MPSKVDVKREEKQSQDDREVLAAVDYALDEAIRSCGGEFHGFSVKFGEADVLMTLRATIDGNPMVSFVGCPDLSSCLRKAVVEGFHDGLRWREDRYAGNGS